MVWHMDIIDSHCHLDDFYADGTISDVMSRARAAQVKRFIAVGTCYADWQFYSKFVKENNDVYYTVGLHPLYVEHSSDLEHIVDFLNDDKLVAIGEIGLDYHRLPGDIDEKERKIEAQKAMFMQQLMVAKEHDLPVVIHSRDAFDDTLDLLKFSGISSDKINIHCYDYGLQEMRQLMDFGCYVSFSGILTYKGSLVEPFKIVRNDRLMIETDCPFLTPVPYRKKRNEPAFLRETAIFGANLLNCREQDFCRLTYDNTERFFGLNNV